MSGFKFAKQKPVFIHGKFLEIEVFRLPTELLVFNIGNGRFAAELIGEEKRLNRKLDATKDVKVIQKLLLEQDGTETEALKATLKRTDRFIRASSRSMGR